MDDDDLISHRRLGNSLEPVVADIRRRITEAGDKPYISVAEQLALVEQLMTFELGEFLLLHQGLNGYWTDYVVFVHPQRRDRGAVSLRDLERFLLDRSPTFLATQERFENFRRIVQEEIQLNSGMNLALASVPCGLMSDLLTLDYRGCGAVRLAGFDLDMESLQRAGESAAQRGLDVQLSREDAWELSARRQFDVVVSNGLNIYEPDDERVTQLYARFAEALKPGGMLVTSFLTPPSEWDMTRIDSDALARQRVIFSDIVGARWQCFRSSELSRRQLEDAGLTEIHLVPDRVNIFPTIVARSARR